MSTLRCPQCDSRVPACERWAQVAVSTLIAAPAVPDMATQVHRPNCRHLFAESEIRHTNTFSVRGLLRIVVLAGGQSVSYGWPGPRS